MDAGTRHMVVLDENIIFPVTLLPESLQGLVSLSKGQGSLGVHGPAAGLLWPAFGFEQ